MNSSPALGANARTTVGAYCIRPPNRAARPEWDVPGRAVGAPDHSQGRNPWAAKPQGARVPGDVYSPPMVAPGGAYSIRPYTGTRTNKPTIHRASGPNISTPQRAARPQQTNNSPGRRPPTPIGKWPGTRRGVRPFFACTSVRAPGGRMLLRPYPTGRRAFQYPAKLGWRP